jgi:DNA-binding MarR family transcriptional regulator
MTVDQNVAPADASHTHRGPVNVNRAATNVTAAGTEDRERFDLRILRAMRRIIRSVDLYSKELAVKTGMTAPQLVCLLTVVEHRSITATAISREIHLSPSTVVGILDRLEEKGLVKRERGRDDRRVVSVTATGEGDRIARRAPSPLQKTLADELAALPESEQATIARSLERVVSLMEAQHIDAGPILDTGPINPPVEGGATPAGKPETTSSRSEK